VDRLGQPRRRRLAEPRGDKLVDLVHRQAGQPDLFETPLPAELGEQGAELQAGLVALFAERPRDEERRPTDRVDHMREHCERRIVGPVQVLHD
jgi:hypothetical protein